jgi:hypothetical protein
MSRGRVPREGPVGAALVLAAPRRGEGRVPPAARGARIRRTDWPESGGRDRGRDCFVGPVACSVAASRRQLRPEIKQLGWIPRLGRRTTGDPRDPLGGAGGELGHAYRPCVGGRPRPHPRPVRPRGAFQTVRGTGVHGRPTSTAGGRRRAAHRVRQGSGRRAPRPAHGTSARRFLGSTLSPPSVISSVVTAGWYPPAASSRERRIRPHQLDRAATARFWKASM